MEMSGGGPLQRQLLKQVEKLQREMKEAAEALAELRIEAAAGGGAVTAVASGNGELIDLRISPEAVDPDDVELLQDLVLAAVREVLEKAQKEREEKMGALTGGLSFPGLL